MKGSKLLVESLLAQGVDTIFGINGGAIIPFYDALYDYQDQIRNVLVRHEQGATHAAEGYARVAGKPGVCVATSGPGATNLVTGISDAIMDSVPIIALGGQVPTPLIGYDAFQESDLLGITTPITKHNFQVRDTAHIPDVIAKSFKIAMQGRPGPVYIDLPKDIQLAETDAKPIKDIDIPTLRVPKDPDKTKLKRAAELILHAESPLIIAGGGVIAADASNELAKLAETINCPVATTTMGKGCFPEEHPLSLQVLGMHGQEHANYAVINSDVLIAIGCRFSDRITGDTKAFQEGKKIIHMDIDAAEISKNVEAEVGIVGDAKACMIGLANVIVHEGNKREHRYSEWRKNLTELRDTVMSHHDKDIKNGGLTQAFCIKTISDMIKKEDIVTTGVGQHQMFAEHYVHRSLPRTWLTSGGAGTMGYGLPCAMGAKFAKPEVEVIDIDGDGSFQMMTQELTTLKEENIKVSAMIMNNGYLGMVRQWLEIFQKKRYSGVTFTKNPSFEKMAEAYHLPGLTVTKKSEFADAVKTALKSDETIVVDVMVEKEDNIWPMLPPASTLKEIIGGSTIFKQSWDEVLAKRK